MGGLELHFLIFRREEKAGVTHTRITFKSNDRFCGFEAVIKQLEGIKTAKGD